MTCEPCPCLSRFSRQSRPSRLSQGLEMAAEAFIDLAGLNALTAYQRCVIPTALAHRLGA